MAKTFKYPVNEKSRTSAKCLSNGRRFSVHHTCFGSYKIYLSPITLCFILTKSFGDSRYGLGRDMRI